jgi:hypothetical protein
MALRVALLALACTLVPISATAQSFPLNAHGRVASAVNVARLNDLSFGATAITPGTGAAITAANGAVIRVDYNEPATITTPDFVMIAGPGGSAVRVDLSCAQAAVASSPAPAPFPGSCLSGYAPPLAGNTGGSRFVYVGGAIAGAATLPLRAGSYAGSFTVTAAYVSY